MHCAQDELKLAMEMIGEPMSEAQLDSMIRASDIDQDGRINYEGDRRPNVRIQAVGNGTLIEASCRHRVITVPEFPRSHFY